MCCSVGESFAPFWARDAAGRLDAAMRAVARTATRMLKILVGGRQSNRLRILRCAASGLKMEPQRMRPVACRIWRTYFGDAPRFWGQAPFLGSGTVFGVRHQTVAQCPGGFGVSLAGAFRCR